MGMILEEQAWIMTLYGVPMEDICFETSLKYMMAVDIDFPYRLTINSPRWRGCLNVTLNMQVGILNVL